jgi:propanediol dehydratase large subunit
LVVAVAVLEVKTLQIAADLVVAVAQQIQEQQQVVLVLRDKAIQEALAMLVTKQAAVAVVLEQ